MAQGTKKVRLLVAYFSYTGNTRHVAQALVERLQRSCAVEIVEIIPTHKRSYLHWLAYSFVPGSEVQIENPEMELSGYDAVLLGFPKWTFSCPPVNRFIRKLRGTEVPKFFIFMTCGGFDEKRFLRSFIRKLAGMGCNAAESMTVKRNEIQREAHGTAVDSFVKHVEEQID
jgi:hypothetical protein